LSQIIRARIYTSKRGIQGGESQTYALANLEDIVNVFVTDSEMGELDRAVEETAHANVETVGQNVGDQSGDH
jgi:hypothetical protein